jgi:hypothetical protein
MKERAMTTLTETLLNSDMMAPAFGFAALAGQVVWPVLKKREHILTLQLGISCSYAAHYALSGCVSGTTVCIIGATQTTVALLAGDRPWLPRLGMGFMPLAILAGVLTFGISHDALVGAVPALFGALLSATVATAAFHRELASRRSHTTNP